MNRNILKLLLFTALTYLAACSSSDNTTKELEETFPEKTPEDHKSNLEQAGLDYVDQMEILTNSESVTAATNLSNLLNMSDPFGDDTQEHPGSAFRILHDLKGFKEGKLSAKDLANRRTKEGEEPTSIQELFDELKGTYTWNSEAEDWDYTEGGDIAVFKFPSEDGGTSNDAEFAIRNYTGTIIDGNPLNESEDYTGDLPTALLSDLSIDGTKVMDYSFNAAYTNNGTPTSLTTALTLSPFRLSYNFSNTTAEISTSYAIKENNNNILSSEVSVQGNFDVDNVESSIDSEDISGIVTGGSSSVQIFDIQLAGNVTDIDGLEEAVIDIDELQEAGNYDDAAALMGTTLNKHLDYKIKYASKNEVIALGSVEGVVMEETYYDYYWDEGTQNWEQYEVVDTWIEPELILEFGDGSKVSLETYGEEGFEDLTSSIEDLLAELGLDDEEDQVEEVPIRQVD